MAQDDSLKTKRMRLVTVDTMVAQIDRLGMTVSILRYENRIQKRQVMVHGTVVTPEPPEYLEEVALLRSVEILRDWYAESEAEAKTKMHLVVYAGEVRTEQAIDN